MEFLETSDFFKSIPLLETDTLASLDLNLKNHLFSFRLIYLADYTTINDRFSPKCTHTIRQDTLPTLICILKSGTKSEKHIKVYRESKIITSLKSSLYVALFST
jgi:hypothetical protein